MPTAAPTINDDLYSPEEIAAAAGLAPEVVINAIGGRQALLSYDEALLLAKALRSGGVERPPLSTTANSLPGRSDRTVAVSGSIHLAAVAAFALIAALGLLPIDTVASQIPAHPMRLVFLATPGPGGGGGGGGRKQPLPPPPAKRAGAKPIGTPLPVEQPPVSIEPVKAPEPIPSKTLPAIVAPIAASAPDPIDRAGVLAETLPTSSGGPGSGSGVGSGTGSGLGEGNGPGIGPGWGGGTGGGAYRPGSGVTPPRLLSEVKPIYPEDARKRGTEGTVNLEIVVRRDGSVGDVRVLRGLATDFDARAIQAVRQWRFDPGRLKGTPVDVVVQVSVEFRLR
jgi:TonB family protein